VGDSKCVDPALQGGDSLWQRHCELFVFFAGDRCGCRVWELSRTRSSLSRFDVYTTKTPRSALGRFQPASARGGVGVPSSSPSRAILFAASARASAVPTRRQLEACRPPSLYYNLPSPCAGDRCDHGPPTAGRKSSPSRQHNLYSRF
jgi:hypothetical protein